MRFYLYWMIVTLILAQLGAGIYLSIRIHARLKEMQQELRQTHAVLSKLDRVLTGVKDEA